MYDPTKSVAENLNISSPLLSRFDLVFILQDKANVQHDSLISSSIINLYRTRQLSGSDRSVNSHSIIYGNQLPENLIERLRWVSKERFIPLNVIRDYVAYAREYCKPRLTRKAANILHNYFMTLRQEQRRSERIPVTTRQLETLIRLSQARAKAALRDFVLEEDAEDVIELMAESVNVVQSDVNYNGSCVPGQSYRVSKRKQKLAFVNGVKQYMVTGKKCSLTLSDLRQVAETVKADVSNFLPFIEELREQGKHFIMSSHQLHNLMIHSDFVFPLDLSKDFLLKELMARIKSHNFRSGLNELPLHLQIIAKYGKIMEPHFFWMSGSTASTR